MRTEFQSFDGATLSYRTEGEGRPVVMLHGFLANSRFNWIGVFVCMLQLQVNHIRRHVARNDSCKKHLVLAEADIAAYLLRRS